MELAQLVVALGRAGDMQVGQVLADQGGLPLGLGPGALRASTWERWTRQMPVNSTAGGSPASQRLVASVHSAARRTSASSWKAAIRWQ